VLGPHCPCNAVPLSLQEAVRGTEEVAVFNKLCRQHGLVFRFSFSTYDQKVLMLSMYKLLALLFAGERQ